MQYSLLWIEQSMLYSLDFTLDGLTIILNLPAYLFKLLTNNKYFTHSSSFITDLPLARPTPLQYIPAKKIYISWNDWKTMKSYCNVYDNIRASTVLRVPTLWKLCYRHNTLSPSHNWQFYCGRGFLWSVYRTSVKMSLVCSHLKRTVYSHKKLKLFLSNIVFYLLLSFSV